MTELSEALGHGADRPLLIVTCDDLGVTYAANCAIFEAVHGSAPDIAGKDIANPTALLQSAILMLRYIDEAETADRVQAALEKVYIEKKTLTRDVGGTSGTKGFTAAVLAAL